MPAAPPPDPVPVVSEPPDRGPSRLENGLDWLMGGLALVGLTVAVGFVAGVLTFLVAGIGLFNLGLSSDESVVKAVGLAVLAGFGGGFLFARSARGVLSAPRPGVGAAQPPPHREA